jgi:V-type H+-transporting ATPase subunit E
VQLKLDERYNLEETSVAVDAERVKKSEEKNKCFGGVILTNEDGLIVCKNTLDSRLSLAYQQMLPTIRR